MLIQKLLPCVSKMVIMSHHENKIGMQALKSFLLRAIKVRYKLIPTLCSFVRKFQIIFHKQVPLLVGFADFFPGLATLCGLLWVSQPAHEIVQRKKYKKRLILQKFTM